MGNNVKTYLSVSDLHVGSLYGLFPENFEIPVEGGARGSIHKLNEYQKYLLSCWNDLLTKRLPSKIDVICIGGDAIDGLQNKSFGELVTNDLDAQSNACIKLLEPLRQICSDHFYLISGTSYHEPAEEKKTSEIAKLIGGIYKGIAFNCEVNGKRINDKHYISTSQGIYTSGMLDREGLWAKVAASYVGKFDIIIRHHVHHFNHVEHGSVDVVTTPGFQVQTPYSMVRNYFRWKPDIGAVLLHIGEKAIHIEKIIYEHYNTKGNLVKID